MVVEIISACNAGEERPKIKWRDCFSRMIRRKFLRLLIFNEGDSKSNKFTFEFMKKISSGLLRKIIYSRAVHGYSFWFHTKPNPIAKAI